MAQEKKHLDYATAIIGKIQELFDDEFESGEVTLELRDRAVNLWRFL